MIELPPAHRGGVEHARLLRLGQPQREGDLPALHGLVRRQPGPPLAAPAGGGRHAVRRVHGRRRRGRREGAGLVRGGRPALGGPGARPRRVRRARPRAARRRCWPTCSSSSASAARTAPGGRPSCRVRCELRGGGVRHARPSPAAADLLGQLTPRAFFDAIAMQVDGPKAWHLDLATRWIFPDDDGETYRVTLKNGVLIAARATARAMSRSR